MKEKTTHQVLKRVLLALLHIYQHTLSLFLGPCCRFFPSCSSYALQSIERFGVLEGMKLAWKRLIKCHPFNPGGYDPVPETTKNL
jgi:putative membrane protein insertion efficiency factor